MKRIVLCFDGTWNRPAEDNLSEDKQVESNVCRFHDLLAAKGADGVPQEKWYNAGVGTAEWDKIVGGAFGAGLDLHIVEGYRYLMDHYQDGDEIFIVGFSRGAYTARSLVGMLRNCGLVRKSTLPFERVRRVEDEGRVWSAYGMYRTRGDGPDSITAKAFRSVFSRPVNVKFLGVWDTVGALGIPLAVASRLNMTYYQFHDTGLSNIVQHAYQAIAMDEHRQDYDICLWNPKDQPTQTIEQRWFAGAHSDVGGGYPDRKLSDIALRWMQGKAADLKLGLTRVEVPADAHRGPLTDSYAQFLKGKYASVRPRHFRTVLSTAYGNEQIDDTVTLRRREAALAYQPGNGGLSPVLA